MKVIAVYNIKGGVGKTTLAVNLASASAADGHRTLLWDLDPQGGAGFLLGVDRTSGSRATSIFTRDFAPRDITVATDIPRLSVLPADHSLHQAGRFIASFGKKRRLAMLTLSMAQQFERIVLDCPPVMNELTDQVINAADVLIVPLTASPLARRALDDVLDELRRNHPQHGPVLPVFSMYDARRKLHIDARQEQPDWPVIPMASVMERMGSYRKPVSAFAPASPAASAIGSLWRGIDRKLSPLRAITPRIHQDVPMMQAAC